MISVLRQARSPCYISPAGMVCAGELAALGHTVTVYDGREEVGGLVRFGIAPYRQQVDPLPDEPLLIAYLDVRGLLSYAERSGLGEDTAYAAFAPDLRRLGSLGLTVTRDGNRLETDARILVD